MRPCDLFQWRQRPSQQSGGAAPSRSAAAKIGCRELGLLASYWEGF